MENIIVNKRTSCRLCDSDHLLLVLPIKASPIADEFVTKSNRHTKQPSYPLDLYQCQECGHVQNVDIVDPEALFRNYIFRTGTSQGLVRHFEKYALDMISKFSLKEGGLIIEIGSNDGTLLKYFKKAGMKVLGIDPATKIAKEATLSGLETLSEFFSKTLAKKIRNEKGLAKLVVANNVYAHSDNLSDITEGIESLLDDDGVFIFEVSYLLDILDNFLFDTVYHEHLSYHSISPLSQFFSEHGLNLFHIEKNNSKGGSVRCFVQKKDGPYDIDSSVQKFLKHEEERQLHRPDIFQKYEREIQYKKRQLLQYIEKAMSEGKRVVGYGASTTVITLMYHFELVDKLEYLIDDNPIKHGLLSPGVHLEVNASDILYQDSPDIVLVLAWQYANPIINKHVKFMDAGGTFVIPLPYLKIIKESVKLYD